MSMDFKGEALLEKYVEDKSSEKVDMGLNSDEEDEASKDLEEEDDESIHDVLGSDENEDNDSEDVVSLDKDDDSLDVPESDKEVPKDDAELSKGHSEEPVNKGKGPAATSEDIAEDDLDNIPLAQKRKELRQNPTTDAPDDLLERFKQSTGTRDTSSAPKGIGVRVKHGIKKPPKNNPFPTEHVGK
ncbi:hypothetical protein LIER_15587 [Lithospermum erythrorhizon]|uniref:Uncharacterized protein n=1 Tax=Lithospermum erythrorhizon TaxID=34254 RepID=A0AAV3Q3G6_LITER